jgi:FkbM family methyltransferase
MSVKQFFRKVFNFLHLDVTKNLEYDRLTKLVLKKVIATDSNCIDIGCHKGEILDEILRLAPKGKHLAFEPIPQFFKELKSKYEDKATVYPYALSDTKGTTTFYFVKNAPAYSGIKKRDYAIESPDIEKIQVEMIPLDDLIPDDYTPHFIKIDVEGGEFGVLKGAQLTLEKSKPVVLFECGLGASEHYGTTPGSLFDFLSSMNYKIFLLKKFIHNEEPLSKSAFIALYEANSEYYFVAK